MKVFYDFIYLASEFDFMGYYVLLQYFTFFSVANNQF